MDYITPEQARRNIVALGLPQIVLDAFDGTPLPYDLDFQFRFPYQILGFGPSELAGYGRGRITPIWTRSSSYTIVAYHHDPARQGFFRFDMQTGEEEQPIGLNWQQLLVKEFKFLWELETATSQLQDTARLLAFKYLDQLIDELITEKLDTFEKDEVWYQSFLRRIPG